MAHRCLCSVSLVTPLPKNCYYLSELLTQDYGRNDLRVHTLLTRPVGFAEVVLERGPKRSNEGVEEEDELSQLAVNRARLSL